YRSIVDGYAVQAKDTFGATESMPAFLELAGEVLMGQNPDVNYSQGKAVKISTGGMLPKGTDGVVMLEYCHSLDENTIEVSRAISPLENVISPGDDYKKNSIILKACAMLRPQDIGILAGLGVSRVSVFTRPKVAIISTGDEIVPIDKNPEPGQVRDINTYTLSAFCRQMGGEPIIMGLCPDDFAQLRKLMEKSLDSADTVWISGGSSVGARDITLKVLESFDDMELLVHGISISPGKPTIIARIGDRAVFGLPGHTASAMVIAEVFLREFLLRLLGCRSQNPALNGNIKAVMSRNIESKSGRDDFIRVRIEKNGNDLVAVPIFGKSGLISTLVDAHGLVRIDRNSEGVYQGQVVDVMLFKS
ncbi:MAG: molybdopterin molybdotransferase MoeA, partial [Deltaproteobacteria bacterium]|nr:molybdopterin molybdotransferase MoeA [Deltaproteobacteria bacterium]